MIDRVRRTIEKYNMIEKGDRVLLGVSGGADSVALLIIMNSLQEEYELKIKVCHINHMLRGDESDRDEAFVKDLCMRLGVEYILHRADIKAESQARGMSLEQAAREVRYRVFSEENGKGKIATAHTASDSNETMLINLLRGTGTAGLCGIPPKRDNIIRPLIECTSTEIRDYLKDIGQEYVVDSTNLNEMYFRNKVRLKLIPLMKELAPDIDSQLCHARSALCQDNEQLAHMAETALKDALRGEAYDAGKLLNLPPAVRSRAIIRIARKYEAGCESRHIALITDILENGFGAVNLPGNVVIEVGGGLLRKKEKSEHAGNLYKNITLPAAGEKIDIAFNGREVTIETASYDGVKFFPKKSAPYLKNVFDYDKIINTVCIRNRIAGDKFRPAGRGCTKKLKTILNELSVPIAEREKILILADESGIIWAEGIGADERAAVGKNTVNICRITTD